MKTSLTERINSTREGIFEQIREQSAAGLLAYWDDTEKENKPEPSSYYKQVCDWVEDNVYNMSWSNTKTGRHQSCGRTTTYGLKHSCENNIGRYVCNNVIKMALIDCGFEVQYVRNIDYETNKIKRTKINLDDVLENNINFIWRKTYDDNTLLLV